jgi:hypothetical protein
MLWCHYCDKRFFDGELVTIRDCGGTEMHYHGGCFSEWMTEQRKAAAFFGHDYHEGLIETFERHFFERQIAHESQ